MGFFSRLFGTPDAKELAPGRGWTVAVVGESQYQAALAKQYRKHGGSGHDVKVKAVLITEADNNFDASAVRVEVSGMIVGYLPREAAKEYRSTIGHDSASCAAKIVGGHALGDGTTASFGIKLNAAWPPRTR